MIRLVTAGVVCLLFPSLLGAQSINASLWGRITDPSKAVIVEANVSAIHTSTNFRYGTTTNSSGEFFLPHLPPGVYRLEIEKFGFKKLIKPDVVIHVQDRLEINFAMTLGPATETMTIEAGVVDLDTTDGTVSTVVDRHFAETLPLNGRSFQSLIELTPGVVITQSNDLDNGQFSVNGQRADANYWTVDGMSANVGLGLNNTYGGNGLAGALPATSVLGGTNSLVSVDAMQEFRIQTSTYAPEFGRSPGAQISIVTRSGTNQLHGTAFEYWRNDILDANNWFADNKDLPKPELRQHDFGGTLSGPILKDRTFFFFSYEGFRLRLPQTKLSTVPDLNARQNGSSPGVQAFLNAYPLPNGADDPTTEIAEFNGSYSDPASLNAYSIRVDHRINQNLTVFGRYNDSPSSISQRAGSLGGNGALSTVDNSHIHLRTATAGSTWALTPGLVADLRFNHTRTSTTGDADQDDFGGAVPLSPLPFPSPFTAANAAFEGFMIPLQQGAIYAGLDTNSYQQQINIVGSVSLQSHAHSLKFGGDYRRLSPTFDRASYLQIAEFLNISSAQSGQAFSVIGSRDTPKYLFRNLGLYAQDTWRVFPRMTLTYGLRWDVDFAPSSPNGLNFPGVTGFNPSNLITIAYAPGAPPYQTAYNNFAPRVGVAYRYSENRDFPIVLRGGFGVFYDLASSEAGNSTGYYPNLGIRSNGFGTYPLSAAAAAPAAIVPPSGTNGIPLWAFDPHLKLPYTLEWNAAMEQGLGKDQTFSLSYVGARGKRLLSREFSNNVTGNPNATVVYLLLNGGDSDYDALQAQFQRRLSRGVQALASYTWGHSIDTASAATYANEGNRFAPASVAGSNRGPSEFDIRHSFSVAVTYDIPGPRVNAFVDQALRGWSFESVIQACSAPPVDVLDRAYQFSYLEGLNAAIRPDLISTTNLYLYGSQYPGREALNPAVFAHPPVDANNNPLRNGNLPRNFFRGFGAAQWDLAVHRMFPIYERVGLQFRAELFNVLNHPNFGPPANLYGVSGFGVSNQILAQSLNNGNLGGGAFDPLYQIGGPRSIQLALKLQF